MEIFVLVLSLLLSDGSQEHTRIRGFYTVTQCEEFIPAYQELIGKFNRPSNVERSMLTCNSRIFN